MTDRLHLSEKHHRKIETLLREYLPGVEVWAYGSRVSGRSHDGSDLDLVLRGPGLKEIPIRQLADFEEAVRESTIPFLVEARDWARLPKRFHREIERNHILLVDGSTYTNNSLSAPKARSNLHADTCLIAPASWHVKSLAEICERITSGGTPSRKNPEYFLDGVWPWVKTQELKDTWISETEEYITEEAIANSSAKILPEHTLLLAMYGATVGQLGILQRPMTCNQACSALLVDPTKANYKFVYYHLLHAKRQIRGLATGAAQQNLSGKLVGALRFPFPSLKEQHTIAHILGTLDDKIELNRRMNETLEAMARAIFKDWFVDFGPVRAKVEGRESYLPSELWDLFPDTFDDQGKPAGWSTQQANRLFEFNPRETLKKGTRAPYLDMAALPTNGLVPEPPLTREYKSGSKFRDGDTLLARITPCLENGKTAYVFGFGDDVIGAGSTEFIVIRSRNPLPPPASYLLARTPEFRAHAERSMTGTSGRQRTSAESVSSYEICTPSNEELWETLGTLIQPIVSRIICNADESQTLAQARDLLLPKLMSGEVRIHEASKLGEPAITQEFSAVRTGCYRVERT